MAGRIGMMLAAAAILISGLSLVRGDVATPRPRWTMVRLESETVGITLGEKRVAVEAVFHMYNEGKAGPVRMGYPVGLFETQLHDFTVTVDGKPVPNVRTETSAAASQGGAAAPAAGAPAPAGRAAGATAPAAGAKPGGRGDTGAGAAAAESYRFEGPYKQWQVFDVDLQEHAAPTIKITYWVEPATVKDAQMGDVLHYCYTLRTGATWKGKISQAVITVTLDGVAPARLVRTVPVGEVRTAGGKVLTWSLRDFKPADNVEITFRPSETVRTAAVSGRP
jgi:hypothetical protein